MALRTGGASNGFCDGRRNGASEEGRTGEGVTLVGGSGRSIVGEAKREEGREEICAGGE